MNDLRALTAKLERLDLKPIERELAHVKGQIVRLEQQIAQVNQTQQTILGKMRGWDRVLALLADRAAAEAGGGE